jgi:hypothetical protein
MEQSSGIPYRKLAWCNTWYLREETLKQAFSAIVDYHHNLPQVSIGEGELFHHPTVNDFLFPSNHVKHAPCQNTLPTGKDLLFILGHPISSLNMEQKSLFQLRMPLCFG